VGNQTIALVGNPNCGKTTLFNGLTGGKIQTGNWPGVTVEKREGQFKQEELSITVVDLPGIYTFSAQSEDEMVSRDYILGGEPSLIVNIIDATNLERNLYLTTQLIEMKVPVLVAVNMMDLAQKQGLQVDLKALSRKLNLPVVGISAVKDHSVAGLKSEILASLTKPRISSDHVEYPNEIESVVSQWEDQLTPLANTLKIDTRWLSIKLLEGDTWVTEKVKRETAFQIDQIQSQQEEISKVLKDSTDIICADYRYGFIHGIAKSVLHRSHNRRSMTDKIDNIALHPFWGVPLFLGVMYMIFWTTITLGGAFIDFFEIFFGTIFVDGLGIFLLSMGVPEWLKVIIADGLGGGIQTVSTFVPIIFMMFFMLSLLEDSGYMARAAFVMDRFMRLLGLPGKSFVPLIVGFGCTVPAVMATRTLDHKRDRLLTIFMSPLMSCGARLPVYALFVAAFFPTNGGFIVFALYIIGILMAVLTGLLMRNTLFKGEADYFVMELPPYHTPRIKHILIHTWDRLKGFILRAGQAIVVAVMILSLMNSIGTDGSFGNEDSTESLLSEVGKTITPVFTPMGITEDNWPATVGLFTGIFAKEAIVGTLNSLYGQIGEIESYQEAPESFDLYKRIGKAFQTIPEGLAGVGTALLDPLGLGIVNEREESVLAEEIGAEKSIFGQMKGYFQNSHQAFAYLLFVLLYFPCLAAFGVILQETGKFLGVLNALYLTLLGWITATLYYQIAAGHRGEYILIALGLLALMIGTFILLGKRIKYQDQQYSD